MTSRLLYQFPSSPTASPTTSGEYLPAGDFHASTDTVYRTPLKKFSDNSVDSHSSDSPGPLRVRNENLVPTHKPSQATLRYHKGSTDLSRPRRITKPRPENLYVPRESLSSPVTPTSAIELESLVDIDLNAGCGEDSSGSDEVASADTKIGNQPRLSFDPAIEDTLETRKRQRMSEPDDNSVSPAIVSPSLPGHQFRRWMRSLRHRSPRDKSPARKNSLKVRQERWSLDDFEEKPAIKPTPTGTKVGRHHKKTSSWSSGGLVTAVKSAAVGLATPQPPKAKRLSLLGSSLRSSGASQATVRGSLDSHASPRVMDEAAWERARQRRRTLEEIHESEESYVADLKVLVNVSGWGCYLDRTETD